MLTTPSQDLRRQVGDGAGLGRRQSTGLDGKRPGPEQAEDDHRAHGHTTGTHTTQTIT